MTTSAGITPPAKVTVIGLGNMGRPMAACISRAGFQVMGFDLSADARSAFAKEGGNAATTIDEAVNGAAAIVTLLPDGKIVRSA
ncbi:MAG: NAD(P)-binding domain-containing protein, partial [Hyphomicrobiales bacterium]|nr:NAD(P)-binding domain-containing protein [Hyphomicrobiales bacterium]